MGYDEAKAHAKWDMATKASSYNLTAAAFGMQA